MQVQHRWAEVLPYPGGWPSLWKYIPHPFTLCSQGIWDKWEGKGQMWHTWTSLSNQYLCVLFPPSLLGAVISVCREVNLQNPQSNCDLEQVGKFALNCRSSAMALTRNKSSTAKFNLGLFTVHILYIYVIPIFAKPYRNNIPSLPVIHHI